MRRWDAFIFDLDGTLIDSEGETAAIIARVLEGEGVHLGEADRAFVRGHAWFDIFEHYRRKYRISTPPETLQEAVVAIKRREYAGLSPLPGAVEAVGVCRRLAPVALVSGSSRAEIELALSALGLRDAFEVILAGEDYGAGKPAPDGFLAAASRLGAAPERTIVFEDSTAGIEAARRAGMRCIAVRAGNPSLPDPAPADLTIDTLLEVSTDFLESLTFPERPGKKRS